ncbi:transposase InsO family protein [Xanthomonas arboricola]|nr:transposase InsO family protein [Xanthomonas arboricola]
MGHLVDRYRVGVRRACAVVKQSRSAFYYQPQNNDDAPLLQRIQEIAAVRVRYGFWRIFVLLRREGWKANHKGVYRLYCQRDLNLRRKRRHKRKAAAHLLERTVLTGPNQVWSMDFVADALFDGRRFRALTVVDNFTKERLVIEVNQNLKGEDVVAVVERLRHQRDLPLRIQTDNGSEFISMMMDRWAYDNGVTMDYSRPANRPTTHSSNRSMAASEMSASTRTGSCRLMTPARRSKIGGSITIISGRTPRSATSRRPSLPSNSLPHPKPNFPVLRGPNAGRMSSPWPALKTSPARSCSRVASA